jgi:hypothetical protein
VLSRFRSATENEAGNFLIADRSLTLRRNLLQQKPRRRQTIFFAQPQHLNRLFKSVRRLMEAGDVILVVLHRIERHGMRKVCDFQVYAIHLRERHLVNLQAIIGDALVEHVQQQIVRKPILLRKTIRRDGSQLRAVGPVGGILFSFRGQRTFIQQRVAPVIAIRRRKLRRSLHVVFELLPEEKILCRQPRLDGRCRLHFRLAGG